MERFLKRHEGRIKGIISGFDRILFRASLRSICYRGGIESWLSSRGILLTDFASFAEALSKRIRCRAEAYAKTHGRPYQHVPSPSASKEEIARQIIEKDQIREGLVCVLGCVEICRSFRLFRSDHILGLKAADRPGLHIYFYFLDREFGLMHVRLQTWIPFTIQVCINGWEWLARRMQKEGISFEKRDNCFVDIADIARAQILIDSLITRRWIPWLRHLAKTLNPCVNPKRLDLRPYYWSVRECEYASDVLFKDAASLRAVYPSLLHHAIHHFHSGDVLRFLQRRLRSDAEVKSSFKLRVEGTRIKHWVQENSIKMYDKQGCVLRVETTINNPRRWKIRRRVTRNGKSCLGWFPMRKGLVDIRRRAQVSLAANQRYLDALSVVGESLPVRQVLDRLAKPVIHIGRPCRPLHAIEPSDATLLSAISRGEFLINGFRNRDLQPLLYPSAMENAATRRKISGKLSRQLRLLRAHGLIFRVTGTTLYRLTKRGLTVTAAVGKIRECDLLKLAA